jgi:hypothetical protein
MNILCNKIPRNIRFKLSEILVINDKIFATIKEYIKDLIIDMLFTINK